MELQSTNTVSRMGACAGDVSGFPLDTITGCRLSNKAVCHISALLDLPWSTGSEVTVKVKTSGSSGVKWWSYKLTESDLITQHQHST